MKTIKNLKPSYKDVQTAWNDQQLIYRKVKAFERWLISVLPNDIKGTYSFDDIGLSTIRVFIYLDKEDRTSMLNVIKWIKKLKKTGRYNLEKFWRKEKGCFAYKIERKYGYYNSYLVFVEDGYDLDGCKITKTRQMGTVYMTDCEKEKVIL